MVGCYYLFDYQIYRTGYICYYLIHKNKKQSNELHQVDGVRFVVIIYQTKDKTKRYHNDVVGLSLLVFGLHEKIN